MSIARGYISHTKCIFPSRLIMDNVIVAYETMHCMYKRIKGKSSFMALKMDMSKAYDKVE